MYKETITYTNYNGNEVTEDFYFNLNKIELLKWDTFTKGGLQQRLEKIVNSKDNEEIYRFFEEIVDKAYGVKSEDGGRFVKNQFALNAFKSTQAYSDFMYSLLEQPEKASKFINSIIP